MLTSTTPYIAESEITETLGVVNGVAIIGAGNSMMMVSASGTAVRIKERQSP